MGKHDWLFDDVKEERKKEKIKILKVTVVASRKDIDYLFGALPSMFGREIGYEKFCLDIEPRYVAEEELRKMSFPDWAIKLGKGESLKKA